MLAKTSMKKIFLFLLFAGTILFSPFLQAQTLGLGSYEVISSEKIDYLKPLVQESLQTALEESDKRKIRILTLSEKQIKSSDISKILKQEKVDAILVGSILKVGFPVQVNSRLYLSGQETKTISDQAENSDQVLSMLKIHAEKIKQILNQASTSSVHPLQVQSNPVLPPPTPVVSEKKTATILRAPLTKKPMVTEEAPKSQSSNFIEFPDYKWMSDKLNFEARSLAVASFDGASNPHLVFVDLNHVYVYSFSNQSLKLVAKYDGKNADQFIRVYTQDLDGDARPEIIVSNVSYAQASSLILKYSETGEFQVLADKIPWLLKSVVYQGSPMLLGEVFYGKENSRHNIKKLKFENGKIKEEGDWDLPSDLGLYGLQTVTGAKQNSELLYLTPSGTLKTYANNSGRFEKNWSSSESYGGSANFIQVPVKNVLNQEEENNTFFNIDPIAWTNKTGDLELLVAKNDTFLKNIVGTKPIFKNSWLVKLKNSPVGYREQWNSKKIDGAVLDLVPYISEKGSRQILALFWLRDKGFAASFKRYPSVLAIYDVE